jgi:hypothetical protein
MRAIVSFDASFVELPAAAAAAAATQV